MSSPHVIDSRLMILILLGNAWQMCWLLRRRGLIRTFLLKMVFPVYISISPNLNQFISPIDYICTLVENKLIKCTERFSKCYDDAELKALRAGTVRSFFEMLQTLPIKNVGILFTPTSHIFIYKCTSILCFRRVLKISKKAIYVTFIETLKTSIIIIIIILLL